jgi:RNA polymerase sigma-70 factor, ECF subfamily
MDEAELIYQLRIGSEEAFSELLSIYQRIVLNICYRFLLVKEDAEDVSQDVFVEVYQSIKNFRGDSKLSTWIYRIAVSKSLDEIKKQNRKKRFSSLGKALGLEQISFILKSHDRADKKMAETEEMQLLLKAMNHLPESQRIAITLSKMEGYTNKQIAELMDTTLIAVESLIYRGKQNLKKLLKQ